MTWNSVNLLDTKETIMFTKVAILCATLVAVNAGALLHGAALAHTGNSITSRHQDAFGNYAFGYNVNGHGASNSQSEVGDAHGLKQSSYNSHINHAAVVAPLGVAHAAPIAVAHAAPLAVAHAAPLSIAHAAPLAVAHGAPLAVTHAAPLALSHANPIAYSTSSTVNHVAPAVAPVVGHAAASPLYGGHGLVGAGHLAYGHGIAGHGLVNAGHLAYANGVAGHGLVNAGHLAYANGVSGYGSVNAGHLAYGNGIAGHGLLAHNLGGIAYSGLKSVHY